MNCKVHGHDIAQIKLCRTWRFLASFSHDILINTSVGALNSAVSSLLQRTAHAGVISLLIILSNWGGQRSASIMKHV